MNDCSCNGTLLSWVAGNDVLLLARVYEKVLDAGEVTDLPFDLSACDDIEVSLSTDISNVTLPREAWEIKEDEDNCLAMLIPHELTQGTWAVEIKCTRNGYHVRSFEFTFNVVETNCEAQTTFEVVDGCQSASVRVALQIVPQALVRGTNDYEMWKQTTTSEDTSLQYFLDNVIDFQGRMDAINAEEAARVVAEAGRVSAETGRVTAESGRVTAEAGRVSNENTRIVNEEAREGREVVRENNESGRVQSESTRVQSEFSRVQAERGRVASETNREEAEAQRESDCAAAVSAANAAATGAEKVNAVLNGNTLTVTDRRGVISTTNVKGEKGDQGNPGVGVPVGGSEGQMLVKHSGQDYDVEWTDQPDLSIYAEKDDLLTVNSNGQEYVDLGLPSGLLWAKCNVGAASETDFGNYYMYGKGAGQYNSSDSAYTGTENPLSLSVDTARQVMGGGWHTPTKAQMDELIANTTYTWVTNFNGSGINGGKFTAQNGNYIFIPAAGYYTAGGTLFGVGGTCAVWSSKPWDSDNAQSLSFNNIAVAVNYSDRRRGYSVRGVIEKTAKTEKYAQKSELGATAFSNSYNDLDNKPDLSGFITKSVNDLVNYYTKQETYTKTEVQEIVNAIKQFTYQVAATLPTASESTMNIIYLVPSADPQTQNVKDEYITIESSGSYSWEQIGSTAIDLSGYYTSSETDTAISTALSAALAAYTTTSDLNTLLAGKYSKPSGGIPKTDLASDVQTSLGKADSALQSFTETDPTVPSWAKQSTKPSYSYSEITNTPTDLAHIGDTQGSATIANFDPQTDTVHITTQVLSAAAQAQVRTNIGAGTSNFSGSYDDLTDKPTIPDTSNFVQKSQTSGLLKNDGTVDTNTYLTQHQDISGKADKVVVVDGSTLPASLDPNKVYQLGTLTGTVTLPAFVLSAGGNEVKIWCFTFNTGGTAPTISWPAGITGWSGGITPTISANKSYEVTVMDGIAVLIEA